MRKWLDCLPCGERLVFDRTVSLVRRERRRQPIGTGQLVLADAFEKSCAEQKPNLCSGKMVLSQLRCNGTMEAVEVMQAAFPSRIAYELIHGNVVKHLPDFMQKLTPNAFFEILMAALDIPREKYQLGLTKLFMKARHP